MKRTIGLALTWLVLSLPDPAHSVGPYVPIGDRVAAAELIVAGEVIGLQAVMGPNAIHTDVTLKLSHTLKGSLSESQVTFRSLGGQFGDLVFEPEESVRYHMQDRLIVLLTRHQSRWVPLSSAENSVVYMGAPGNSVDWQRAVNRIAVLVSGKAILPETDARGASGRSSHVPTITSVRPQGAAGMDSHPDLGRGARDYTVVVTVADLKPGDPSQLQPGRAPTSMTTGRSASVGQADQLPGQGVAVLHEGPRKAGLHRLR